MLATYGSPGDVQPFLAIGQELQRRGHTPVVATSDIYRSMVERAGLSFAPARPNRMHQQKDPDFLQRLGSVSQSPATLFRDMFMPDLRASTADLLEITRNADAVVVHTLVAGGRLAAEFHEIPWISAVMQPMGYLSVHEPPVVGPGWIAAVMRRLGASGARRVFGAAKAISAEWTRDWHHLRTELRLPATPDHPLWEGQHSPRRSLGLFPSILGRPQADWPASARVTGFPAYRPEGRRLSEELVDFLRGGEAPVVFTLGTTAVNDPGSFYEVGARAIGDLGQRAVMVVGKGAGSRAVGFGKNVLAVEFEPHDLLFPRARAVVHQAGIGTLSEALLAGKPMLIMPYGHDQADNAWRASRLGVARVLPRHKFGRRDVRNALKRLLEDPGIKANAAHARQDMTRENGDRFAADYIEAALDG